MNQILYDNVTKLLLQVIDYLYQENLQPAYTMLAAVLPQLEELLSEVEEEADRKLIIEKLNMALEAMEQNDGTLLADILQYELLECLNTYKEKCLHNSL